MTTAFLSERAVPKRAPRDRKVVGVRTIGDLFRRLFG